jgi:hypothetical protein
VEISIVGGKVVVVVGSELGVVVEATEFSIVGGKLVVVVGVKLVVFGLELCLIIPYFSISSTSFSIMAKWALAWRLGRKYITFPLVFILCLIP